MNLQSAESRLQKFWPRRVDVEQGYVYRPPQLDDVKRRLDAERLAVLCGAEGRGKSTLACYLAFEHLGVGTPVWFLSCTESATQTLTQLAAAIQNSDSRSPIWIVDDYHLAELSEIADAFEGATRSRFLFVGRHANNWPVGALIKQDSVVKLQVSEEAIGEVLRLYVKERALEPRFIKTPRLNKSDYEFALTFCGGNLRTLKLCLDSWDPRTQALDTLTPTGVASSVVERVLKPMALKNGKTTVDTLGTVATFSQWDASVPVAGLDATAVTQLELGGFLVDAGTPVPRMVRCQHASDARHYLSAYSLWRGITVQAAEAEILRRAVELFQDRMELHFLLRTLASERPKTIPLGVSKGILAGLGVSATFRDIGLIVRASADSKIVQLVLDSYGKNWLVEGLRTAKNQDAAYVLSSLREKDATLSSELSDALTLDDRVAQYLRDPLVNIASSLLYYHKVGSLHFAREVLLALTDGDLGDKVSRGSAPACGRLLKAAFLIDPALAARVSEIVASRVRIIGSPEKIGLLLSNVRTQENASAHLVARVLDEYQLESLIRPETARGYGYLMATLCGAVQAAGQTSRCDRFFVAWEAQVSCAVVAAMGPESLSRLIHAYSLCGRRIGPWFASCRTEVMQLLGNARGEASFFMWWNIFQLDTKLFADLTHEWLSNRKPEQPLDGDDLAAYALAGLMWQQGVEIAVSGTATIDSLAQAANELASSTPNALWLFSLLGLLQKGPYPRDALVARFAINEEYLVEAVANGSPERPGPMAMANAAAALLAGLRV